MVWSLLQHRQHLYPSSLHQSPPPRAFTMRFSTIIPLLTPITLVLGGGFIRSCNKLEISNTHYLYAHCRQNDGGERLTNEDLNLCIANDNGQLVAREGGGYGGSCSHCYITGSSMKCDCQSASGKKTTSIDLDPFIGNDDGYMWCFGHRSAQVGCCDGASICCNTDTCVRSLEYCLQSVPQNEPGATAGHIAACYTLC
ncbi:Cyanovirin-N [Chaetomium tenue]|uniref:Cyanovirin-N n=1 Tax=Chaetomium tenue TaxID=1854479 RepID=A0ACB7P780_9PEZI|nr:Cyanovirin-N [Chaetomium globosum]